jgi:hypothetical protein
LLEFCCSDATTVRITRGGDWGELSFASVYLPYNADESPPIKEMRDVIDYCYSRKQQLVLGCDTSAQTILWGSTDTNRRGEALMEYLVNSNLNILNRGNEPIFVVTGWRLLTWH